jgi:hypothetical protein
MDHERHSEDRLLHELLEESKITNKELVKVTHQLREIVVELKKLNNNKRVVSLVLKQIGEQMSVSGNIIGLTPGQTAKFQVIPVDVNGNQDALIPGTTLTYESSDSTNAPASADPADPSGLTMLVPVSANIPAGSTVTFKVTASAQADGTLPTTGPVPVSTVALAVKSLVLNQLS